jgi:hypothetical protein
MLRLDILLFHYWPFQHSNWLFMTYNKHHGSPTPLGPILEQVGGVHSSPTIGMPLSFLYTYQNIKKCVRFRYSKSAWFSKILTKETDLYKFVKFFHTKLRFVSDVHVVGVNLKQRCAETCRDLWGTNIFKIIIILGIVKLLDPMMVKKLVLFLVELTYIKSSYIFWACLYFKSCELIIFTFTCPSLSYVLKAISIPLFYSKFQHYCTLGIEMFKES